MQACDGVGTDEDTLTRVVVGRRHRLRDINNKVSGPPFVSSLSSYS
jgi:hypothetical protein